MRFLFIGRQSTGKTSLAYAIDKGAPANVDEGAEGRTIGIDLTKVKMTAGEDRTEGQPTEIDAVLWDFAGQQVYYSVHSLFLTKRALYILCWDMQRDDIEGEVKYWLDSLQSHVPGRLSRWWARTWTW
eukprot:GFYU01014097.1.p2 GENE.GFYU01014097.1~~GFYU01014097.1.p2  ORF type:complete len:128 (-),score=34.59 GFYU01014097.1:259-642(-)